jgi:acetolactate synthase I/II/III large subunit
MKKTDMDPLSTRRKRHPPRRADDQRLVRRASRDASGPPPSGERVTTVALVLLRAFVRHGVRVAYGIPGGAASPIFDALAEVPELAYVATRHEAIAAFAAMGHARATGLPALVLTTSGPGVINALTGVAAAYLEDLPLILISGEIAEVAVGRGALQDGSIGGLDLHTVVRSMTRWSGAVLSASNAAGIAERAFLSATEGRPGPVFLSVPIDVGTEPASGPVFPAAPTPTAAPDRAACREAALRLVAAKRPLLVLGNGARNAASEALALAERLTLPVVTTAHAKGVFPETSPLYVGLIGAGQHPSVTEYLARPPDVTCVVGSRLGDLATTGWAVDVSGSSATIQVDREPWLIGRNARLSLGIIGDAALSLQEIIAAIPPEVPPRSRRIRSCRSLRPESAWSDALPLKPQRVLAALAEAFPEAVWCVDVGEHLTMAQHYLRIDAPSRYHSMVGLGSMGSGIGLAIGMKQARAEATVLGLCGDGGFAMHAGEVLTCVESGISVVYVVFNDGRWNMVEHGFKAIYGRLPKGMPARVADISGVASAFGALGVRIELPEDLALTALRAYATVGRPVVLDVRIDPQECLSVASRSAMLRQFVQRRGR